MDQTSSTLLLHSSDIKGLVTRTVYGAVLDTVPGPRESLCLECRNIVHGVMDRIDILLATGGNVGARHGVWVDVDVVVSSALQAVEEWRPSCEHIKAFGDDARHRSIETMSIAREMLRCVRLQRSIHGQTWTDDGASLLRVLRNASDT
jgi:hypothetical protein